MACRVCRHVVVCYGALRGFRSGGWVHTETNARCGKDPRAQKLNAFKSVGPRESPRCTGQRRRNPERRRGEQLRRQGLAPTPREDVRPPCPSGRLPAPEHRGRDLPACCGAPWSGAVANMDRGRTTLPSPPPPLATPSRTGGPLGQQELLWSQLEDGGSCCTTSPAVDRAPPISRSSWGEAGPRLARARALLCRLAREAQVAQTMRGGGSQGGRGHKASARSFPGEPLGP